MHKLFALYEFYTNGFNLEVLDIISIAIIITGIFIITTKNPIVSVLFLITLFGSVTSYLIITGLNFLGLSYLIVYIGAVSILFLFILMLINIRISELQSNTRNSIFLALFIGVFFNYTIFQVLPSHNIEKLESSNFKLNDNLYPIFLNKNDFFNKIWFVKDKLYFSASSIWDNNLIEVSHIGSIGNIIYTNYNLWLIIASLILLLAMVGAIIITIKNNKKLTQR